MPDVTLESLAAEISYLKAALHELLARVPGRVAVDYGIRPEPSQVFAPFPEGPRVVEVRPGLRYRLVAPVCADFEPSFYAGIFGRDTNPHDAFQPYANEPSNAPPGQPARSASGYPLHYTTDGRVLLVNADGNFVDEAAIEADRRERAARQARSEAEWAAYRGPR